MTYINNINYFKIVQNNTTKRVIVLIGEFHNRDDCRAIGVNTPFEIGNLLIEIAGALPPSQQHTPHLYIECPKANPAAITTPSMMFDMCNLSLSYLSNYYTVDNGIDDRHEFPELVELNSIAIYFPGSTPLDPRNLPIIINILRTFKIQYETFITMKYNKTIDELMRMPHIHPILSVVYLHFTNLDATLYHYNTGQIDQINTLQNIHKDLYPIILSVLDISISLRLDKHNDFTILYTGSDHCQTMSQYLFNNTTDWYTLYEGTNVAKNCITIDIGFVLNIIGSLQTPVFAPAQSVFAPRARHSFGRRLTAKAAGHSQTAKAAPKVKRSPSSRSYR